VKSILKIAPIVLTILCCFAASFSQDKLRTIEQPAKFTYPDTPIRVELKFDDKEMPDRKVIAGPDWIGRISLEVTNTSRKDIGSLWINLTIREPVLGVREPSPETAGIAIPVELRQSSIQLLSVGNRIDLKPPVATVDYWTKNAREQGINDIEKLILDIRQVGFTDGTVWTRGRISGGPDQDTLQTADEPTQVTRGVMTDKQRRHSKEFEGREIQGLDSENDLDFGVDIDPEPRPLPGKPKINNADDYLRALACAETADAIVVGTIISRASQLTENGRFVFTDYDVKIQDVLKRALLSASQNIEQITITVPGGAVKLDGHVLVVRIRREQPFRIGDQYILFLRRLKGADSFMPASDRGVFAIEENKVKPTQYDLRDSSSYRDVIQKIRSFATTCEFSNLRD
jgi:hypothetical protein